jgi:hypothetical protein
MNLSTGMRTWSALQLATQVAALASTDCGHNKEDYLACELVDDLQHQLTNALPLDRLKGCLETQDASIASSILAAVDAKWLATLWADLLPLVIRR